MFGSSWLMIDSRLIKVAEYDLQLAPADVHVVLRIFSKDDRSDVRSWLVDWFAGGGHRLDLFLFADKKERGIQVAKVLPGFCCLQCGCQGEPLTRKALEAGVVSGYRVLERELSEWPQCSLTEVRDLLALRLSPQLFSRLSFLIDFGFGSSSLGKQISSLSRQERTSLSLFVSAENGLAFEKKIFCDLWALGFMPQCARELIAELERRNTGNYIFIEPPAEAPEQVAIAGADLTRTQVIECAEYEDLREEDLLSLLGLEAELALALAREREAQVFGLTKRDLIRDTSKLVCRSCRGRLSRECPVCEGDPFEGTLLRVRLGDLNFEALLRSSIKELAALPELEQDSIGMLEFLVDVGFGDLSLARAAEDLAPGIRKLLFILGRARGFLFGKLLKKSSLLLQDPYFGMSEKESEILERVLRINQI
jgi:hypothetical protein